MTRSIIILLVIAGLALGACDDKGGDAAGSPTASESPAPGSPDDVAGPPAGSTGPPAGARADARADAPGDAEAAPPPGGTEGPPADLAGPPPYTGPPLPTAEELGTIEERIQRAEELIQEMIRAYQAAPMFSDTVVVDGMYGSVTSNREQSMIRLGRGVDFHLVTDANEITVVDGVFLMSYKTSPDRFMKLALVEDALATITDRYGSYGGILVQAAMRYGKPMPEIMYNLAFGIPGQPRISGYRIITDLEGRTLEQISLVTANGSGTVNVDPSTKFIVSADVDYLDPGAPIATFRITRSLKFSPQSHEELSPPIEFDPAGRIAVRTRDELIGTAGPAALEAVKFQPGDMAPDFELPSMLGEKFKLSDQRGSAVVLVFWASWNVKSLNNLAKLNPLAQWAAQMRNPARVVAIETLWKTDDKAEEWQRVYDYWERENMEMLALIDSDHEVAKLFGVIGVPLTIVIDPSGRVYRINVGIDEETDVRIRSQIIEAVREST